MMRMIKSKISKKVEKNQDKHKHDEEILRMVSDKIKPITGITKKDTYKRKLLFKKIDVDKNKFLTYDECKQALVLTDVNLDSIDESLIK